MNLFYSVKFRAIGITFGSTSGLVSIDSYIKPLLEKWIGISVHDAPNLLEHPVLLVDKSGVRLELRPLER